jgi:hypothetical protein
LLKVTGEIRYEINWQNRSERGKCSGLLRFAMTESLIAHVSLALCGMALIWILLYRFIVQRLNLRHPKRYVLMRGTARLRKSSIDWLFSFLQFLCFGEHRELQDPTHVWFVPAYQGVHRRNVSSFRIRNV